MNQVIYRDGIQQGGPLRLATEEATKRLEEEVGPLAEIVSVEWDRGEDAALCSVVILRLFDPSGSVTAIFDPEELKEPTRLRRRFRLLWGDLLQIRLGKQLETVLRADGNGEATEMPSRTLEDKVEELTKTVALLAGQVGNLQKEIKEEYF